MLILSLFPGVGLLDLAFEEAGCCVVRAPDLIHGGDIGRWNFPPAGRFTGVIAGPPCQGFSVMNNQRKNPQHKSVQNSRNMLCVTVRIIEAAQPVWAMVENVPAVPDIAVSGYSVQRVAINDFECDGEQLRWRAIQFAHRDGGIMRPVRVNDRTETQRKGRRPIAITTKPVSIHQTFAAQCRKQGLSSPIKLAGWTKSAKFQAVGNGVPLSMGRILAAAVLNCDGPHTETDCACGCGREVAGGRHKCATDSCRKRIQQDRERARPLVDADGYHTGRTR